MALDKIVDSSQLDADLTTVANAIRTKGGTSAQLSFPSGMAEAIAAISGGGGSLPSSITNVDGGSFIFAADTEVQRNKISHSLGVAPKGYAIWSEEVSSDRGEHSTQRLAFSLAVGIEWNKATGNNFVGYCYTMWKKADNNVAEQTNNGMTINSNEIAPSGYYYWQGGATYKWLAWA